MDLPRYVAALALFAVASSAASVQEENCDFLDKHLEGAINAFIEKLPKERHEVIFNGSDPRDGLNLMKFKFENFDSLRPFGPYFTFCHNGSMYVQFDLVNTRPLFFIGTASFTGNDTLQIESNAQLVRFTAQFEVEGAGDDMKLHPTKNLPVTTVGVSMAIKRVDQETTLEVRSLRGLTTPDSIPGLWEGPLYRELEKVFAEILEQK